MASLIPSYEYDIFISYRQKDNKYDGWVTEFVDHLKKELEATFKEDISVYFDINPHDGLLETHDVDASLKDKLKCLVFIPIISRTYCDPKSFAWEHEFKAFVELASQDQFGLKVKLPGGNVANRVLPVQIHELDAEDRKIVESELGGFLRGIEFIYKEPGVNRPLMANEDHPDNNLNKTFYRNQINKVANAVKEIITAIKKPNQQVGEVPREVVSREKSESLKKLNPKVIIVSFCVLALIALGYFFFPKMLKPSGLIEKSIAVLPFINDSPSDSNQYFINGFMEDVLNHLQSIKDIHPISRTSAEKYRKTTKSITEIAKELNVNYIVEGDMQRYGNSIRLSVNLFKALKKEFKLWGKTYEKKINDATDIFSLQSQIAQSIATELEAVITPQERSLIEKTPTTNLAAYEDYLQGNFYLKKFSSNDLDIAMHYFELAKEIDPNYALAYTGISGIWEIRAQYSIVSPAEATPLAMAALAKALALDSTRAEVHNSLANIQFNVKWDWKGAESSYKKAITLNPSFADAHANYSALLLIVGRTKEGMEQDELARKLDPYNTLYKAGYGLNLLFTRRYDDAITLFNEVLKKDPSNVCALGNLPEAFHQIGRYKEELEAWKSYYGSTFKNFANVFDLGYTKAGYVGALNLEADTLVAQSKTNYINPFEIAVIYACAGNKKRAMDMLERAYEVHDPNVIFLLYPVFDTLRNEPRFQELAQKLNIPYK